MDDIGRPRVTTAPESFQETDWAGIPIFELPPPDTKHWVPRRKAIVVTAVRLGLLSIQDACARYNLSLEEFLAWQRALNQYGVPGLRTTRLQIYRDSDTRRSAPARFNLAKLKPN